eukprot:GHVP01019121.1.p1 GENE.GHVP01019121.1~~GHVP01019121.1.p1  ORF type:complete len:475 (-),score=81.14 GHVP01019121.1:579-1943(-)
MKVLVCAPSNFAVDELLRRIMRDGLYDKNGEKQNSQKDLLRIGGAAASSVFAVTLAGHWKNHGGTMRLPILPKKSPIDTRSEISRMSTVPSYPNLVDSFARNGKQGIEDSENTDTDVNMEDSALCNLATICRPKRKRILTNSIEVPEHFEAKMLKDAKIIFTTLSGAGCRLLDKIAFDAVLIDEATQATEPNTLCAVRKTKGVVVLVGDDRQLPPTVLCTDGQQNGFDLSLFERLRMNSHEVFMLEEQYRMHPKISNFCSEMFYNLKLQDYPELHRRLIPPAETWWNDPVFNPMVFFSLKKSQEKLIGNSYCNKMEVKFIRSFLRLLRDKFDKLNNPDLMNGVACITGYKQQAENLKSSLLSEFPSVTVGTVDSFQGKEADFVIISTVRGGQGKGVGFLSDSRRLNVAISRARLNLWVVGDEKRLARNSMWKQLVLKSTKIPVELVKEKIRFFN